MVISIIIPVYNVSAYIQRCLDSVVNQDFDSIECILVDDCGSDNSAELALNYIHNHTTSSISFKMLHHPSNRGLSAARNTGVEAANGDYILFLDSDDELAPHALDNMHKLILRYGEVDIVQGVFSRNDNTIAKHMLFKEYYKGNEAKDAYLKNDMCLTAWNKLIKANIAKKIKFIEGIINEDNPWSFQVFKLMESLCVCKETTYIYYITPNSIMSSPSYQAKSLSCFKIIYDNIISEMEAMTMNRPYPLQKVLNRYVFGFMLMPGADNDTFAQTRFRLIKLYKENRHFLSFRDYIISRSLYLQYPYCAKYAKTLRQILNRMCKLHIIDYG